MNIHDLHQIRRQKHAGLLCLLREIPCRIHVIRRVSVALRAHLYPYRIVIPRIRMNLCILTCCPDMPCNRIQSRSLVNRTVPVYIEMRALSVSLQDIILTVHTEIMDRNVFLPVALLRNPLRLDIHVESGSKFGISREHITDMVVKRRTRIILNRQIIYRIPGLVQKYLSRLELVQKHSNRN